MTKEELTMDSKCLHDFSTAQFSLQTSTHSGKWARRKNGVQHSPLNNTRPDACQQLAFQNKYVIEMHRDYAIAALLTSPAVEEFFNVSACLFMEYLRLNQSRSKSAAGHVGADIKMAISIMIFFFSIQLDSQTSSTHIRVNRPLKASSPSVSLNDPSAVLKFVLRLRTNNNNRRCISYPW